MASQLETTPTPAHLLPLQDVANTNNPRDGSVAGNAGQPRRQCLGLAGSIWAPQPSESPWSKAIDSLARPTERDPSIAAPVNPAVIEPMIRREDLFPPTLLLPRLAGDIGAVGDRRKMFSNDLDDAHVGQLLRTLNLNSPEPNNSLKPNMSFDTSFPSTPDFSPASISSALLTPSDMSPAIPVGHFGDYNKFRSSYDLPANMSQPARDQGNFGDHGSPTRQQHLAEALAYHTSQASFYQQQHLSSSASLPQLSMPSSGQSGQRGYQFFDPFLEHQSRAVYQHSSPTTPGKRSPALYSSPTPPRHLDSVHRTPLADLGFSQVPLPQLNGSPEWANKMNGGSSGFPSTAETPPRGNFITPQTSPYQNSPSVSHEPINFLSLLHPSSSPPYPVFVSRIIKSSDQQASIFLQQKLKVAESIERAKIVDAICARGFEMMAHRFGNWAVQRCLEAASTVEERRKIVSCMRGRIVELATNCYGCHVLQKALDCEEDIRLLIVSELLHGDPAQTLVNKHASHVWSKIMELTWTPPAPPIFAYVNNSLKGKWAALACHETGSLVVQHAFENLEEQAKGGIVDELLNSGPTVFADVAKNQWGSYCIQHILEHGSEQHRQMTLDHLITGLLEFAVSEQGAKSLTKALKEGGEEILDRVVKRTCEPARGGRRPMIVDMALSVTGSQLIATVLPTADKDQRALLYDCIKGHIVTLRGCKTGSKVIWLFDRMRAYYGY